MSLAISAAFPRDAPHVLRFTGIEEFSRVHIVFRSLLSSRTGSRLMAS